MKTLVPRLNYKYTLADTVTAFKGIFKKQIDETPIQDLFNNKHIYFTNHARTGLRIALNSLNLKPGARIGVQVYNCHTVFNAISQAGYEPVFIDINYQFQMDPEDLNSKKSKINALIITHLFGIPANMDKILETAKDLPIIEDCAHAFLSKFKGRLMGTFGDIGVFSIGKAKFPSIGSGGYVLVNNEKYIKPIQYQHQNLKGNPLFQEFISILYGLLMHVLHTPLIYGSFTFPFLKKLDKKRDLSGKFSFKERKILKSNKYLFLFRLNSYKELMKKQQNNAREILKRYSSSKRTIDRVLKDKTYDLNCFMVPIKIGIDEKEVEKNKFFNANIEIDTHFKESIAWAKKFGYKTNKCKQAELIIEQTITIPTHINKQIKNYSISE